MVVYQNHPKSLDVPLTFSPPCPERTTPEDILPIKKQSKYGIKWLDFSYCPGIY